MHAILRRRLWPTICALALAVTAAAFVTAEPDAASAASRPDRFVDVTKAPYDAAGNGSTNDRAAIQRAIDDLGASGGGTVVLPAGRTFRSGNLTLESNVTLEIDGTLLQSQDPDDYTYLPILGHSGNPWFQNYPFIYAGGVHNVGVIGAGTIQMTHAPGGDQDTIHVVAVGFARGVDGFEVAGLEILNGHGFNVQARESRHGVVRDLVIDTRPDNDTNGDGININSAQYVRITGNRIYNTDDAIVIGSSYGDPRAGTWWLSNSAQGGSQHIEIDHNVFENKPIAFYPLANNAPDERWSEVADIDIHDNYLPAGLHAYCSYGPSGNHLTAVDNVRIVNNDYTGGSYTYTGALTDINRFSNYNNPDNASQIECARITDLVDDFGKPSYPTFLNPGFEQTGTAYWSTNGDAGAARATDSSTGPHSAAARRAAASFADGDWYGYVEGAANDAALYQGLGLNDAVRYRFQAKVLNSDRPAQLFVQNTCTGQTIAQQTLSTTSPQTVTLDFTAQGTCGNYHVGVALAGQGGDGWALIDDTTLTITDTVLDDTDPAFTYSAGWSKMVLANTIGNDYHLATAAGSTATVSFTGSRAFLYGLRRWKDGQVDVYLDGVYEGRIDTYNVAFVDHQVLFDTGPIVDGPHTVRLVTTGTRDSASIDSQVQLDALVVRS